MADDERMLQGAGGNVIPDVPLGRAWLTVVALVSEAGGKTITQAVTNDDLAASWTAIDEVGRNIYGVDPDDLGGFAVASIFDTLEANGLGNLHLSDRAQRALTGAVAGAILTGIQLERDRGPAPPPPPRKPPPPPRRKKRA